MKLRLDSTSIETLEPRIAPAAVFVSPTTATYIDADGDNVTVKFSKPILTDGVGGNVATVLVTAASGGGELLTSINLTSVAALAVGTSISVTAQVAGTGDGLANVGRIVSPVDLGTVLIRGDLNEIDAGGLADTATPALKSLTVQSFGVVAFNSGGAQAVSTIRGSVGKLLVKTDFLGPDLRIGGTAGDGTDATLGSLTIGGTLSGSGPNVTGYIEAQGNVGTVKIGGSIFGNSGNDSGEVVSSLGKIGNVSIGGSIFGGGNSSGGISSALSIGSIKIVGSMIGGSGTGSAFFYAGTGIGAITIGGSLTGGAGNDSGSIYSDGNIGAVKIAGDLRGGGTSAASTNSGQIIANGGSVASVTIGGDAVASFVGLNGSILARDTIGAVKIGGSIYSIGAGDFTIRALGTAAKSVAIASLTVTGGVRDALILAGYNLNNAPTNGNASIGAVKVGTNWITSSIAAGVQNAAFPNFGDGNDALIGTPTVVSKIASITIGGFVSGTTGGTDHYGFVAQQIGTLKIAGTSIPLSAPGTGRALGLTGDFTASQVA